jgi:hypothetical protein
MLYRQNAAKGHAQMSPPSDEDKEDEDARLRASMVALVVVVALVVGSVWLLVEYRKNSEELDCILAGHKNCAPVDPAIPGQ